jgi:hypothetical protein
VTRVRKTGGQLSYYRSYRSSRRPFTQFSVAKASNLNRSLNIRLLLKQAAVEQTGKAAIAAQTVLGEYGPSANASKAAPIFHMGTPTTLRFLEAQIKDWLRRPVDPALLARVRAKISTSLL